PRRQMGSVYSWSNPTDLQRCEFHYRHAINQAKELNMRPLIAHFHLSLGELYARIGQSEKAEKELTTAVDLYRLMEMTAGLHRAEAALSKISNSIPSTIRPG